MFVIAYDIADDRRRTRVADICKDYGVRIQYSIFEADISADRVQSLIDRVERYMDATVDKIRIYTLCSTCNGKTTSVGLKTQPKHKGGWII